MKNIKQYIAWIKELLKNPRTRAAVKLVLWLIFFIIVFALLNINKEDNQNLKPTSKFKNMNNYEYQMTFTINEDVIHIHGLRSQEEEIFSLQEHTYVIENNALYQFQNDVKNLQEQTVLLGYDFLKLRPEFLNQVLSLGTLEYTTKYENGSIKKGYLIETSQFILLYDGRNITDDSSLKMDVLEENGETTEVHLDLENFQKYQDQNIHTYQINIKYFNIDAVTNMNLE